MSCGPREPTCPAAQVKRLVRGGCWATQHPPRTRNLGLVGLPAAATVRVAFGADARCVFGAASLRARPDGSIGLGSVFGPPVGDGRPSCLPVRGRSHWDGWVPRRLPRRASFRPRSPPTMECAMVARKTAARKTRPQPAAPSREAEVSALPVQHTHAAGIDVGDASHWHGLQQVADGRALHPASRVA